ncbi:MAG: thioester reductase domain-containing protein [Acidobacteria bacterium]|nr:thioester reductase domain-containing protein [Acidobacteriota bacterium]
MADESLAARLARMTPEERAVLLRQAKAARAAIARRPEGQNDLPLSPAQQRMWFLEQLQPGAYHSYDYTRLRGPVDADRIENAYREIVRRHEALRTGFVSIDGTPRQIIHADAPFTLQRLALTEEEALDFADAESLRPFDLTQPPLLRATLIALPNGEHLLFVTLHHIVSDGWSLGVLDAELRALYAGESLPALPVQFGDVVLWQISRLGEGLDWWKTTLAGVPDVLDLPADHVRPAVQSFRGARVTHMIAPDFLAQLNELAQRERVTLFMLLVAAFETLLARHTGQTAFAVGTPVANRTRPETEPLVGLFINTVALRADVSGDPSFRELLQRVRETALEAFAHQEVPFDRVVDALALPRNANRTPLYQTMIVLGAGQGNYIPLAGGVERTPYQTRSTPARFDLTLSLSIDDLGLTCLFDYAADLFEPSTVEAFGRRLEMLLRGAVADATTPISRLPLMDDAERSVILRRSRPAASIGQAFTRIHVVASLGERDDSAAKERGNGLQPVPEPAEAGPPIDVILSREDGDRPRAGALVGGVILSREDGEGSVPSLPNTTLHALFQAQAKRTPDRPAVNDVTYAELDKWSDEIAATIDGNVVPFLADRTPASIAKVLGILKAGAAYLPIDPGAPQERIDWLIDDSKSLTGEDNAYLIYTSGSTGTPKGVVVTHRAAVNLALAFAESHGFAGHRILMIPPLHFDASVGDVFPALATGATLILHPSPADLDARALARFCEEQRVTAIDAPAALWRRWAAEWQPIPALTLMMVGGEAVPVEEVRRFARLTGNRVHFVNHYGPTEATVCATTYHTVDASECTTTELPIGKPIANVSAYILDEHGELVPDGIAGELAIGGVGVARYHGREEFPLNPFGEGRLYRTGDLVRRLASGDLLFLGRVDRQIKLRGFRIEPGEIEAAILAHPGMRAALVMKRDERLVAYVVGDAELQLHDRLPEYMVPSAIVRLEALPLTSNGKVDLNALPAPPRVAAESRAPRNEMERELAALWSDILELDNLGIDDDFFVHGGDSLRTMPLIHKVRERFGVDLPLSSVFRAPTVARFAALLTGSAPTADTLESKVTPIDVGPALQPAHRGEPRNILLTGATGFLGAYLLAELQRTTTATIYALVRAANERDAMRRIRENLASYGLPLDESRIVSLLGDLAEPNLGLDDTHDLAEKIDLIIHNGGAVNFVVPYERLAAANVEGTRTVLQLAATKRLKPVHLVSTLGVQFTKPRIGSVITEESPLPPGRDILGGYNETKWVADRIAQLARESGLPVSIHRPARITGDSQTGALNPSDLFYSWIQGCVQLGSFPDDAPLLNMAPVDHIARSIVALALHDDQPADFHYFNNRMLPLTELVAALRKRGFDVGIAPYKSWIEQLRHAPENPLAKFLALMEEPEEGEPIFDCTRTETRLARLGIVCPAADESLINRYLDRLLPEPAVALEGGA